jgi:hypothetical protein
MRDDEPLEGWLYRVELDARRAPDPPSRQESRATLTQLAQALAAQPEGKVDFDKVRRCLVGRYSPAAQSTDETATAQQLFFTIWAQGGPGVSYVIPELLEAIALAMQTTSIPFWKQVLDLSRPRDQYINKRRGYALAALALLAIVKDDAPAYAALAEGMTHTHEQVRALAAFYLRHAYTLPKRPVPPPVEAALVDMATHDTAFVVRFQAREALRQLGRHAPRDNPDQVYFLKVQLRGVRATRTIAILPDQTLESLHYAIQRAFDWDADHLYSFYMNGNRDDQRYALHCPELDSDWDYTAGEIMIVNGRGEQFIADISPDDAEDEGGERSTTNTEMGMLGLVPKHAFMYFFDYGDSHEFTVTVLGIEPQADGGSYPRLVESRGQVPPQYHAYDEE